MLQTIVTRRFKYNGVTHMHCMELHTYMPTCTGTHSCVYPRVNISCMPTNLNAHTGKCCTPSSPVDCSAVGSPAFATLNRCTLSARIDGFISSVWKKKEIQKNEICNAQENWYWFQQLRSVRWYAECWYVHPRVLSRKCMCACAYALRMHACMRASPQATRHGARICTCMRNHIK